MFFHVFCSKGTLCWVKHKEEVWAPAEVIRASKTETVCGRKIHEIFWQTARCEKKTCLNTTCFWTNFEQNCFPIAKLDADEISNFGVRFSESKIELHSENIENRSPQSKLSAINSSRISFRDIKIRILRPRFGQNLAPWIFLRTESLIWY